MEQTKCCTCDDLASTCLMVSGILFVFGTLGFLVYGLSSINTVSSLCNVTSHVITDHYTGWIVVWNISKISVIEDDVLKIVQTYLDSQYPVGKIFNCFQYRDDFYIRDQRQTAWLIFGSLALGLCGALLLSLVISACYYCCCCRSEDDDNDIKERV